MQRWNVVSLAGGIHISLNRRRDMCIPCSFVLLLKEYRRYHLTQLVTQLGLRQESNSMQRWKIVALAGGIHISLTRRRDMCIPSLVLDFLSYPLLNEILSVILI